MEDFIKLNTNSNKQLTIVQKIKLEENKIKEIAQRKKFSQAVVY